MSHCSAGEESVQVDNHKIVSWFCGSVLLVVSVIRAVCRLVSSGRSEDQHSEATVLCWKRVECCLMWKSLAISGSCSQVMGKQADRQIGAVWAVLPMVGKKELSQRVKLSRSPHSTSHLWSRALGSDGKNEVTDTRRQNEFPQEPRIRLTDGMRSLVIWEPTEVVCASD